MGFRTRHLDTVDILSWRSLTSGRSGKDSLTFPPKQAMDPHVRGALSVHTRRKGASLSPRGSEQRNQNKQASLTFPSFLHCVMLCPVLSFHDCALFFKPSIKLSGLTISSGLCILMKAPKSPQTCIKYTCTLFSCSFGFISLIFRSARDPEGVKENLGLPSRSILSEGSQR